jgi:hypothetical protein
MASVTTPKVDVALTGWAIGYMNQSTDFIHGYVCPPVACGFRERSRTSYQTVLTKFDRRFMLASADASDPTKLQRAPGAQAMEHSLPDPTLQTINLDELAGEVPLPDESSEALDLDWEQINLQAEIQIVNTGLERLAALALFTNTNFASGLRFTLASGSRLNESGIVPAKVLQEYARAVHKESGVRPNVLVVGADVYTSMLSGFGGNITGGGAVVQGVYPLDYVAQVLGFEAILPANAIYNSANQGQAYSGGYIWTPTTMVGLYMDRALIARYKAKTMATAALPNGTQLRVPNMAYRMIPNDGRLLSVDRYRDESRKSSILRATAVGKTVVVSDIVGFHITTAVAAL